MAEFSAEIERATAYCTYCPKMCRFSCPAAEAEKRETVTPWGMMRLLEVTRDGSVELDAETAEIFYHCTGCRRCQSFCKHDNDVPEALWAARAWARRRGHVPEAVEAVREQCDRNGGPREKPPPPLTAVHDHRLDEVFDAEAEVVYMPSCETRWERPADVVKAGLLLEIFHGTSVRLYTAGAGATGSSQGCCGFPLLAGGDRAGWRRWQAEMKAEMGEVDLIVTGCASMAATYAEGTSWEGEDWSGDEHGGSGPKVMHLVEFLAERLDFVQPRRSVSADGLMLHDSCYVGRQLELYEPFRQLVAAFCDGRGGEFEFARDEAPCCGAAGLYDVVEPEGARRAAETRLEQMEREGGARMVCGSANCARAFRQAAGDGSPDDDIAFDVLELAFRAFELA